MKELTAKQHKYYTYFLIDPRDNKVFYVGKGCGLRIKSHAKTAKSGKIDNPFKFNKIKNIQDSGFAVVEKIHSYHDSEDAAFEEERLQISLFEDLTNIKMGTFTKEQTLSKNAQILLDRLKSYDDWSKNLDTETASLAKRVFGSMHNAYYSIKGDLCALA